MAAGITTCEADVTDCYSLMNYDDIINDSKFTHETLQFDENGYVSKYPTAVKPIANTIYPIAASGGEIRGSFYTYGGPSVNVQATGGSYHSMFELLHGIQTSANVFFKLETMDPEKIHAYEQASILTEKLTKLPAFSSRSQHFGDWLERPAQEGLWARFYKDDVNPEEYALYFEKGGRNDTGHPGQTFVSEYLGNGREGFLTYNGLVVGDDSFENCPWRNYNDVPISKVTTVDFAAEFTAAAKPQGMRRFFYGMDQLSVITGMGNLDVSEVQTMNGMFQGCSSLMELNFENGFRTLAVTDMGSMFSGCSHLGAINFGTGFTTSAVTDMSNMFLDCSSLLSLNLERFTQEALTDTSGMFSGCTSLTTIHVLNDGNGFEPAKLPGEMNSENMFLNCTSLAGAEGSSPYPDGSPAALDRTYAKIDSSDPEQKGYFTPPTS